MTIAYWLYKEKGWSPYKYFKMPYGEKTILRAFVLSEMEKAKEEQEEYEKMMKENERSGY